MGCGIAIQGTKGARRRPPALGFASTVNARVPAARNRIEFFLHGVGSTARHAPRKSVSRMLHNESPSRSLDSPIAVMWAKDGPRQSAADITQLALVGGAWFRSVRVVADNRWSHKLNRLPCYHLRPRLRPLHRPQRRYLWLICASYLIS